ncbi:rhodanese-like domain-containing protein [Bacteroidota bacterium]
MNKLIYLFAAIIVIVLFVLTACKDSFGENDIKVEDFVKILQNDSTAIVLDVRTETELTGPLGQIDGVINLSLNEIGERFVELEDYHDNNIYVICRSGNRSKKATKFLIEQGFKAKNVWGGMIEFRAQGN